MRPLIIIAIAIFAASAQAQSSLELTSPNGGEIFLTGSDTAITWTGIPLADTVKLEYSTDGGSTWNLITDTATAGKYLWHVPGRVSSRCEVRVEQLTIKINNWIKEGRINGYHDLYSSSVIADRKGNIYVTGQFQDTVDFGEIVLSNPTRAQFGDMFIVKFNPDGKVEWAHSTGGIATEVEPHAITTDPMGNVYVTGFFYGPPPNFGGIKLIDSGGENIFVVKYHSDGTVEWATRAGGSDEAYGIASDISGNIFITGRFGETVDFQGISLTSVGSTDIFIVKYHPDGNVEWAKRAGGSNYDAGFGLAVDSLGNIYETGTFSDKADFDGFVLTHAGEGTFVAKYHSDGIMEWVKSDSGSGSIGRSIATDKLGNIYVTGNFNGSVNFGLINLQTKASDNIYVSKFHSDGSVEWANRAGSSTFYSEGLGIALDSSNECYVTGYFTGQADFNKDTIANFTGPNEIFLANYQTNGIFNWVKIAGGDGNDIGSGVCIGPSESLFVTGQFENTVNFDEHYQLKNTGNVAVFLWKIGNDDTLQYIDTSDTFFSIDHPKLLISISDNSGYPGDHKNIPMILESAPITSVLSVATNFSARVAYDRTVLYPTSGIIQHGNLYDTLTITGTLSMSDTLGIIPFTAMLGKSMTSPMNLVNFTFLDNAGNPAGFDAETENGVFHLLGVCPAGGNRLYNPDGQVSMAHVTPNPSNGIIHIDIQTTELGRTQLSVMNLLGAKVATISDGELEPGAHAFDFNTAGLSAGSYFLLMQTPTVRKLERIDVSR